MSTKIRNFKTGIPYHIYNRGNKKENIFLEDEDFDYFVSILFRYSNISKSLIVAYSLMPNHYHLLIISPDTLSLSLVMQRIGTAYHYYWRKKYKLVGHIFQGRFNSKPVDTITYLNTVKEYILQNPYKDGLVKDEEVYKWNYINESYFDLLPHMLLLIQQTKDIYYP